MNKWRFVLLVAAVVSLGIAAPSLALEELEIEDNLSNNKLANDSFNDKVEGGAAANDYSDATNDSFNDKTEGQAAANDKSIAVAVKDSLNDNKIGNDETKGQAAANDHSYAFAAKDNKLNNDEVKGKNAANDDSEINNVDGGTNAANNGSEIATDSFNDTVSATDVAANDGSFAIRINDVFIAASVVELEGEVSYNFVKEAFAKTYTGDNYVTKGDSSTFTVNGINQLNQNTGFNNLTQQSNSFAITFQAPYAPVE